MPPDAASFSAFFQPRCQLDSWFLLCQTNNKHVTAELHVTQYTRRNGSRNTINAGTISLFFSRRRFISPLPADRLFPASHCLHFYSSAAIQAAFTPDWYRLLPRLWYIRHFIAYFFFSFCITAYDIFIQSFCLALLCQPYAVDNSHAEAAFLLPVFLRQLATTLAAAAATPLLYFFRPFFIADIFTFTWLHFITFHCYCHFLLIDGAIDYIFMMPFIIDADSHWLDHFSLISLIHWHWYWGHHFAIWWCWYCHLLSDMRFIFIISFIYFHYYWYLFFWCHYDCITDFIFTPPLYFHIFIFAIFVHCHWCFCHWLLYWLHWYCHCIGHLHIFILPDTLLLIACHIDMILPLLFHYFHWYFIIGWYIIFSYYWLVYWPFLSFSLLFFFHWCHYHWLLIIWLLYTYHYFITPCHWCFSLITID